MQAYTENSNSDWKVGDSYLLPIEQMATFWTIEDVPRPASITGEIQLLVTDVTTEHVYLSPARFTLASPGVQGDGEATGLLCLYGRGGNVVLTGSAGAYDATESTFDLGFLSEASIQQTEIEVIAEDRAISPRAPFSATISAGYVSRSAEDGAPGLRFSVNGELQLVNQYEGAPDSALGQVRRISIALKNAALYKMGVAHQAPGGYMAMARTACPEDFTRNPATLKIQLVGLRATANAPTTGSATPQMLQAVTTIWNKACITIDSQGVLPVTNAQLLASTNIRSLYRARPIADPFRIPVFFVQRNLAAFGGGFSESGFLVNGDTALAIVVISETAADLLVMAHELGHVLGGVHPGDPLETGQWEGAANSILQGSVPGSPFTGRNPAGNCEHAAGNAVSTDLTQTCCTTPDP